ncbi:MAG TPA: hypothetical protein VME69_06655 [Methylocella sp.]|nr:hypothetical protein [Methylocella sp.]
MNVEPRTLAANLPTATTLFDLAYRGMERVVATFALLRRRAHEHRQLAMLLSTSSSSFLHDTSILCTHAEVEADKPFWPA